MKTFIRNIFKRFGYDVVKTGIPYIPVGKNPGTVMVGKFAIMMPGNNVQLVNYKLYPDMNSQFGRLAKYIHIKYPGMTVVDVGANVGDTIAVLKNVLDFPVIGIEGDDVSFEYLKKNTRQFSNVSIIKAFLGDKSQQIPVTLENSGWNTTLIPDNKSIKSVSVKTLDEVIQQEGFEEKEIKLLKVDVEGFDTIVLRGASSLIRKNRPVLFFEYNRHNMKAIQEDGLTTVLSFLGEGYDKIVFFDHKGTLLLATSLKNKDEITFLHNYISSDKNLLGYFDICIFHHQDSVIANIFIEQEEKNL